MWRTRLKLLPLKICQNNNNHRKKKNNNNKKSFFRAQVRSAFCQMNLVLLQRARCLLKKGVRIMLRVKDSASMTFLGRHPRRRSRRTRYSSSASWRRSQIRRCRPTLVNRSRRNSPCALRMLSRCCWLFGGIKRSLKEHTASTRADWEKLSRRS